MERDQAQKRIRMLAYTDELTGLASRASFIQHMEEVTKISSRHDRRFGLLYIDLDNFKNINDSLGHDAGDLLLKIIAERLRNTCRDIDFIARLGGDEFCILLKRSKNITPPMLPNVVLVQYPNRSRFIPENSHRLAALESHITRMMEKIYQPC
jgi:GGDEF domain-containing protein